ncbi:MAG: hypothetical protein NT062_03835 [Proteobacteria bacterium]|nr:hypothetical protein [Pseudomonadota bacterium]
MTEQHIETLVEVGEDAGSISLLMQTPPSGTPAFFTGSNTAGFTPSYAASFEEGLALLDAVTAWPSLWVIEVHPRYASHVLRAVEERWFGSMRTPYNERALQRWRRVCTRPDR